MGILGVYELGLAWGLLAVLVAVAIMGGVVRLGASTKDCGATGMLGLVRYPDSETLLCVRRQWCVKGVIHLDVQGSVNE